MNDTLQSIVHGVAGSAGGIMSFSLTYPLTTIVTRLQVQSTTTATTNGLESTNPDDYHGATDAFIKILKNEGLTGLYSGLKPGLIAVAVSQGVYYYWYSFFRKMVAGERQQISIAASLVIAALSGSISVIVTNPIWIVAVRMQVDKGHDSRSNSSQTISQREGNISLRKQGVLETSRELITEEGFFGLWKGLLPNLVLVLNPAIQYMVYEYLKAAVESFKRKKKDCFVGLTAVETLLLGAIAKAAATIFTYPYITIKSRLQVKPDPSGDESKVYKGTRDVIEKILKYEGVTGFFKGLKSKIFQSVLTAALLFLFQDKISNFILRLFGDVDRKK